MAYIGDKPSQTLASPTSQYFNGDGSTVAFTLNRAVNVAEDLEVFVNNIQQEPGVGKSYTATGTTLTFDAAPSAGTANVYVVYRGLAEVTTRLEHDPNAALAATTGTFSGVLTIENSADHLYLKQSNADNGWLINTANADGKLRFSRRGEGGSPSNNERLVIETGGSVGIGQSSPNQKLDVNGNIVTDSYSLGAGNGIFLRRGYETNAQPSITVEDHNGSAPDGLGVNGWDGVSFRTTGTERMRIDSSGRVTMPYQPSFRAGGAPAPSAGNNYVNYPTVNHNIGNHFNATNGRFTAPVAGRYLFVLTVGNNSSFGVDLMLNGGSTICRIEFISPPAFTWQTGAVIMQLSANDFVVAYVFTGTAAMSPGQGNFSGHLLG